MPTTEVPALQGVSRGKLILVNDDDLTYCSLRLDPDSLQTVLTRIADIAEPLPRTLAWSAAWEMTREAELKARDFVALVMSGMHAESEVGVAQRLLMQAQTALGSYADPGWANDERLARVRRPRCWIWPASRRPVRTISWRSSTRCAPRCSRRNHVAVLVDAAGQRTRRGEPAGPGDRHRSALAHRHRAGRAAAIWMPTEPRPRSSTPRRPTTPPRRVSATAAAASAARPQAAVKEAAWQQVIEDDTLANITARAIIGGFVATRAGRAAGTVHRSATSTRSAEVWERRSSEVAQTVVIGLYPSWDISQDAHRRRRRVPGRPDVPPALRRLVLEGRAGVERSLRAREFDAS